MSVAVAGLAGMCARFCVCLVHRIALWTAPPGGVLTETGMLPQSNCYCLVTASTGARMSRAGRFIEPIPYQIFMLSGLAGGDFEGLTTGLAPTVSLLSIAI